MNILDENIVETQCRLLRKWRIRFRQIGFGVGREGMKDSEIISLLHDLASPTFITRRLLRHPEFNTKAKRMGSVVRVSHAGLMVWRLHTEKPQRFDWPG